MKKIKGLKKSKNFLQNIICFLIKKLDGKYFSKKSSLTKKIFKKNHKLSQKMLKKYYKKNVSKN